MRVLRLSKEKMYISVTYDISSTKARNKLVTLLESYGFRVQKSVFEIELNESQYKKLKKESTKILKYAKRLYSKEKITEENGAKLKEYITNGEDEEVCISNDSIKFYILSKIGEGNLDGRIDGLGDGYESVYIPEYMIL